MVQKEGPLCNSPLENYTFSIDDIFSNCGAIKRGNGQIISMTRMAMYRCLINADMTLQEPIHTVKIICKAFVAKTFPEFFLMTENENNNNNNNNNNKSKNSDNNELQGQRYRSYVFANEIEQCHFLKPVNITVRLPVSETIGLGKELDKTPLTQVESLRMTLHHWER